MNNKIVGLTAFVAGFAAGVATTCVIFKKKYMFVEEVVEEENNTEEDKEDAITETEQIREVDIENDSDDVAEKCEEIIERYNYKSFSDKEKTEKKKEVDLYMERLYTEHDKPYTIPPDDFALFDDYETMFCDYFADGVLAEDNGKLVEDIDDLVGFDNLRKFGEYEDDTIYVRNDQKKLDIEICKDLNAYKDLDESEYSYTEKDE